MELKNSIKKFRDTGCLNICIYGDGITNWISYVLTKGVLHHILSATIFHNIGLAFAEWKNEQPKCHYHCYNLFLISNIVKFFLTNIVVIFFYQKFWNLNFHIDNNTKFYSVSYAVSRNCYWPQYNLQIINFQLFATVFQVETNFIIKTFWTYDRHLYNSVTKCRYLPRFSTQVDP